MIINNLLQKVKNTVSRAVPILKRQDVPFTKSHHSRWSLMIWFLGYIRFSCILFKAFLFLFILDVFLNIIIINTPSLLIYLPGHLLPSFPPPFHRNPSYNLNLLETNMLHLQPLQRRQHLTPNRLNRLGKRLCPLNRHMLINTLPAHSQKMHKRLS